MSNLDWEIEWLKIELRDTPMSERQRLEYLKQIKHKEG